MLELILGALSGVGIFAFLAATSPVMTSILARLKIYGGAALKVTYLRAYDELRDVSTPVYIASDLSSMPSGRTASVRHSIGAYGSNYFTIPG